MEFSTQLLIVNFVATLYLLGLIWMVQIVHYPLFAAVGRNEFVDYQKRHQILITWVVAPPMLVEALSAILIARFPPSGMANWPIFTGIALVLVIWVSTALVQVPCHTRLAQGFDQRIHARLVRSNWIRTVAWTARGLLTIWMLAAVLGRI